MHGIRSYAGVFALGLLCLCACNGPAGLPGHYEGTLLVKSSGQIQQIPVRADISEIKGGVATIPLVDSEGKSIQRVQLGGLGSMRLTMAIPGAADEGVELVEDKEDGEGCYADADEKVAFLCTGNGQITLGVNDSHQSPIFELTLNRFSKPQPLPTLEPSATFTLDQAVARALAMSFSTRIEFQRAIQARTNARNAYFNLLPHVTGKSILTVVLMDAPGMLEVAADLVPFLFPNRWFQAGESSTEATAENDTVILTKADTALQTQTISYALMRDEQVLQAYDGALKIADGIRNVLQKRVDAKELDGKLLDDADSAIIFMRQDRDQLGALLDQDRAALSQTLGFYNPNAVHDVVLSADYPSIGDAKPIYFDSLLGTASSRSFELRQMDALIGGAQLATQEVYFDWLDPAADPSSAMGFGIGEKITNLQSQLQELLLRRQQIEQMLVQSVNDLVEKYSRTLESYADILKNIEIQNRRVAAALERVQNDRDVDVSGAYGILQDQLAAETRLADLFASYRGLCAKRDRLLLQGYYSGLSR